MSWLSDAVRSVTGGYGVGESAGAALGYVFSGGSPTATAAGARIGGGITERIDMDTSEGQATARDIPANLPRETGMSGQQQYQMAAYGGQMAYPQPTGAFTGGLLGPAMQIGQGLARTLRTPQGGALVGGAVATAADYIVDFFGNTKKLVITRKMKREVNELYMYMNGDLNAVAAAYSQYKSMNFTPAMIQKILLKRFRNDGPYVTKAAIRKTRSTVRKLERLEMLKKQITGKPATTRRRATSTTRITQVK